MSARVDHRLVDYWQASQRRQQAARETLPPAWRRGFRADLKAQTEHPIADGSSAVAHFPLDDR